MENAMAHVHLMILLSNVAELRQAYGAAILPQVEGAVLHHLRKIGTDLDLKVVSSGQRIGGQISIANMACKTRGSAQQEHQDLEEALALLCLKLACQRDVASLAELSAMIIDENDMKSRLQANQLAAPLASPHALVDVCAVEQIMGAIRNDALFFHFQPIFDSSDIRRISYFECLTRARVGDDEHIAMAGDFIPTLEQSGLMRPLDRYNVKRVVGILKMEPMVSLGVNISAQSTVDDIWWTSTMLELKARPDIAERLVIEITETSPVIKKSSRSFSKRMQALGCRIAIDDFGVGHSIETAIELGGPDLIKIDKKYIASIRSKKSDLSQLICMVKLAKGIGQDVAIEGVENEIDMELARKAGVNWVQGYYLAAPSALVTHSKVSVGSFIPVAAGHRLKS